MAHALLNPFTPTHGTPAGPTLPSFQVVLMLCERQQGPGHGPIQLPIDFQDKLSGRAGGAELVEAAWFTPLDTSEQEQLRRAAETITELVQAMKESDIRLPVM
jgi:hypothetical protein